MLRYWYSIRQDICSMAKLHVIFSLTQTWDRDPLVKAIEIIWGFKTISNIHLQPWYWWCRIRVPLSTIGKDVNYMQLHHISYLQMTGNTNIPLPCLWSTTRNDLRISCFDKIWYIKAWDWFNECTIRSIIALIVTVYKCSEWRGNRMIII